MDSTPPSRRSDSRSRTKSASRVAHFSEELLENIDVNRMQSPQKSQCSPLQLSANSPNQHVQLQDLLLLSPSPLRRSNNRAFERVEPLEDLVELVGSRRKCRTKSLSMGLMGCASPRNSRRLRRRAEQESRDERDLVLGEEHMKVRKRRQSRSHSRLEKLVALPSIPSPDPSSISSDDNGELDCLGKLAWELIMWKDVAKSSLWFGFGSLCFMSSSFTSGYSFSIISTVAQTGLLFLAISFFYNSISQRTKEETPKEFKLKEDDIVRAARLILPPANAVINKTKKLFSGKPSMTLKMAPLLLFASEYGYLITLWRLSLIAFFVSFTVPKLYSCYSQQIQKQVGSLRSWMLEAWTASSHKKLVAASAATVFWNLSAVKTRIFAAFMAVVIIRYYRQQAVSEIEEGMEGEAELQQTSEGLQQEQLAMVVANETQSTSLEKQESDT
ncbi:reticulon-like protein B18 isoform X2 [Aristolochia californica]|uniref:reticulon-like protein B18 isoform X2 n=1 Tax=Aristolochia californica TaxID=171875 RepID=UPI0035D5FFE6